MSVKMRARPKKILQVRQAIIAVGLVESRLALLAGIPDATVASLLTTQTPGTQVLLDLDSLNKLGALGDGSVPLIRWLNNAVALADPRKQVAVFRHALALCESAILTQRAAEASSREYGTKAAAASGALGLSRLRRSRILVPATVVAIATVVILISLAFHQRTVEFYGQVFDSDTHGPISNMEVQFVGLQCDGGVAQTDAQGLFISAAWFRRLSQSRIRGFVSECLGGSLFARNLCNCCRRVSLQ